MHSGRMKDKNGKLIPKNIIKSFKAEFEGKEIFKMEKLYIIKSIHFLSF